MDTKEALVVWCEFDHHDKTRSIPQRIADYLRENKPVYYIPSDSTRLPAYFPLSSMELVLSGERGMQDASAQHKSLVEKD